jgi:hypothetical protein
MNARFAIDTPVSPGAVAVVRVMTGEGGADAFFEGSGVRPVAVGASGVRSVFGLDHALVARPDGRTVLIMPHGGGAIVRGIADALERLGLSREGGGNAFPEAADAVTARMLESLARTASPLGVGLLLDQPRRWAVRRDGDPLADGRVLGRLIDPPVVVAVGAVNIGKSSLVNALAGASVALAFDRAGTTRDAVGVLVDMGGLVVRWVDTPGIGPGTDAAMARVRAEVERADLTVRCADAGSHGPIGPGADHPCVVTVATRVDRAEPRFAADAATSAASGLGLDRLVAVVRERLVPAAAMADPAAWRFWPAE